MCRKYTDINHVNLLLVSLIWRMVCLAFHLLFCHSHFFLLLIQINIPLRWLLFSLFPSHWPFHTGGGYAYLMDETGTTTPDHSSTQCYSLLSCPELTSGHTYSSLTSHMLQLPMPTSVSSLSAHSWKLQWKISYIV